MSRRNCDERALSECAACHEEFKPAEGGTYYPEERAEQDEGLNLCNDCVSNFERELEYQLDSDTLASEQWAALRLWVQEEQEQVEQAQDEGEPALKVSRVRHEGATVYHWEVWTQTEGEYKAGYCCCLTDAINDARKCNGGEQ